MVDVETKDDLVPSVFTNGVGSDRPLQDIVESLEPKQFETFFACLTDAKVCNEPFQLVVAASVGDDKRYFEISGQCFEDQAGSPHIIGLHRDVTSDVKLSEKQEILLRELQHRVKNTLSTILAIVRFSADSISSVQELVDTLEDRLMAIAKTHDILTDNSWTPTHVSELLRNELTPYSDSRDVPVYEFSGDDLTLQPEQALALTLAFHELATNAVKYGALSVDTGRIKVRGRLGSDDEPANLIWKEVGGPKLNPASERVSGFGTLMIEQILASELQGSVEREFKPSGLECCIEIPQLHDAG